MNIAIESGSFFNRTVDSGFKKRNTSSEAEGTKEESRFDRVLKKRRIPFLLFAKFVKN